MLINKTYDVNIASQVLAYTNPLNKDMYIEAFECSVEADAEDVMNTPLLEILAKLENTDPSYVPLALNSAIGTSLLIILDKLGIKIEDSLSTRELVRVTRVVLDIRNHEDLVDYLRETSVDSFDISDAALMLLDIECFNLGLVYDDSIYVHNLYASNMDEIYSVGDSDD